MDSRPPIASPCIRVCAVSGQTGLCLGCGRTLKEIGGWTQFTDAERAAIMAGLPARLAQAFGDPGAARVPCTEP